MRLFRFARLASFASSIVPLAFCLALVPVGCGDSDSAADGTDATIGTDSTSGTDTTSGSDTTGSGTTPCDFTYTLVNEGGGVFAQGCESDADCEYNVCLKPGVGGNITNNQFGFCSRGCDCNDDNNAKIPVAEKELYDCLYPSGFVRSHHIVVECTNAAFCQAIDPRWTECKLPDSGGARKVCHAL